MRSTVESGAERPANEPREADGEQGEAGSGSDRSSEGDDARMASKRRQSRTGSEVKVQVDNRADGNAATERGDVSQTYG
jgi:hypothetical protein